MREVQLVGRLFVTQKPTKPPLKRRKIARLALPDDHDAPAGTAQLPLDALIAQPVPCPFRVPKLTIRRRPALSSPTSMGVPEAAMYEDHRTLACKDKIGRSRQVASMQAIAVSHRMNKTTDGQFRGGVLSLDPPHRFASG